MSTMVQPAPPRHRMGRRSLPAWGWAFVAHLALMALAWITPFTFAAHSYVDRATFGSHSHLWFRWDALWFWQIGVHGYAHLPGVPPLVGTAFFPWVPLLARVCGLWGAWLLTQAATLASLALAWRVFQRWLPTPSQAIWAVWALALNPAAIYYSTLYAEPWTVLFTLATLEAGHQRRWGLAALTAGLAATTAGTGILIGLVPLWEVLRTLRRPTWATLRGPFLWGCGAAAGLASYMVYLGLRFHDPLLFATIQHTPFWTTRWSWPWAQWFQAFSYARSHQVLYPYLNAGFTLGAVALLGWGWWFPPVVDPAEGATDWRPALAFGTVLACVATSFAYAPEPLHSTVRLLSPAVPLYAVLARLPKPLRWTALVLAAIYAWLGAALFLHGWWFQ